MILWTKQESGTSVENKSINGVNQKVFSLIVGSMGRCSSMECHGLWLSAWVRVSVRVSGFVGKV